MAMKNFVTAIREGREEAEEQEVEPLEFRINGLGIDKTEEGEPFVADRLTMEQFALFTAAFGSDAKENDTMAAMVDLLRDALRDRGWRALKERLADPKDMLEIGDMQDIIQWIAEESVARPTKPRSGSAGPRGGSGRATSRAS